MLALAAPLGLLAGGCTCSKTDGGSAADPGASSAALAAPSGEAAPRSRPDDEVRPVYPADAGPPDPIATRYCEAVQALPEKRKAACCTTARTGVAPTVACVRTLTYALGQHAVTVDAAALDRCVEAMTRATLGCDWVTPFSIAIPLVCQEIVTGKLAEKERCRSSLECVAGLRCQGLSSTDLGACGPPRPARMQCGVGADMLATYTRQDGVDRDHPECAGRCARGQCEDAAALGAECKSDAQCGKSRCVAGKCADSALPALGAACPAGACAPGAGCVAGVCVAPKAEGAACGSHAECRGECVTEDGGAAGTCAKRCPAFALPPRVAPQRYPISPELLQRK
ncbi:MAG: hypothetical protein ABJE95_34625 [Byssovorax sp.]